MSNISFVVQEAWESFRQGLRSGVLQLLFIGLVGYLLLVISNAAYLRDMGAVGIPRNAPPLIYLMSAGQAFYLIFAMAWLFGQAVIRDHTHGYHELIYAMPRSLQQILLGRFIGAFCITCCLGMSQAVGILLSPALSWLGLIPSTEFMAIQWQSMLWGWLLFVVPLALGLGSLFFAIAIKTRSTAGPFALAAGIMLLWMFSMVILKSGHISVAFACVLDPSGFAEAETQISAWTPHQKMTAFLGLSKTLLINRALWGVLPLGVLAWVLFRVRREHLLLGTSKAKDKPTTTPIKGQKTEITLPPPVHAPIWRRVLYLEVLWNCGQLLRRRSIWFGLALLILMGIAGSFVHVIGHADGPLIPRPALLGPLLQEFVYLVVVFILAGVIGHLARRDDKIGFSGQLDATPAPHWVRFAGRVLSIVIVTLALAMIPALAGYAVTLINVAESASLTTYTMMSLTIMFPALLEISALTLLCHALLRKAGPAYALSMLLAFILVLNHELRLVTYPLLEFGIPVHMTYSTLTGWSPWVDPLSAGISFKIAIATCLFCIAGMAWPRGVEFGGLVRWRSAMYRLPGILGILLCLSIISMCTIGWLSHRQYVSDGGHQSHTSQIASDAQWERRWLAQRDAFSVAGGDLRLRIAHKRIKGTWILRGVRTEKGRLHASLPKGFILSKALCNNRHIPHQIAHDHLMLNIAMCNAKQHPIVLEWEIATDGWSSEGKPSRLVKRGFWLRAKHMVPRLGMPGTRILRSPKERNIHNLPSNMTLPEGKATPSAIGVAPAGHWRWHITTERRKPQKWLEVGSTKGPLLFGAYHLAVGATTQVAVKTAHHNSSYKVTTAPEYTTSHTTVARDVEEMRHCVERIVGQKITLDQIKQVPRGIGRIALIHNTLWIPEDKGWDAGPKGTGRWLRQSRIARAIARYVILSSSQLRAEPGSLWMSTGVPGAIGILCVGKHNGTDAFTRLLSRGAERITTTFSASTTPITTLSMAKTSEWVRAYAPLAALYWTSQRSTRDWQLLFRHLQQHKPLKQVLSQYTKGMPVSLLLGAPNASDLTLVTTKKRTYIKARRWRWSKGEWHTVATTKRSVWRPSTHTKGTSKPIVLDRWCSFERTPKDNTDQPAQ